MNYPTVKLPENASLDVAYEQAVATFESADLYVHRHETFSSLGDVGKLFSCHEDERNDTFIVHAGPWTDDAIEAIKREAESLLEMQGFMGCTGVQIIATHPLPAELSQFAKIESSRPS